MISLLRTNIFKKLSAKEDICDAKNFTRLEWKGQSFCYLFEINIIEASAFNSSLTDICISTF